MNVVDTMAQRESAAHQAATAGYYQLVARHGDLTGQEFETLAGIMAQLHLTSTELSADVAVVEEYKRKTTWTKNRQKIERDRDVAEKSAIDFQAVKEAKIRELEGQHHQLRLAAEKAQGDYAGLQQAERAIDSLRSTHGQLIAVLESAE